MRSIHTLVHKAAFPSIMKTMKRSKKLKEIIKRKSYPSFWLEKATKPFFSRKAQLQLLAPIASSREQERPPKEKVKLVKA